MEIPTLSRTGFFQKLDINLSHLGIPLGHLMLVMALGSQTDQMEKETGQNKVNEHLDVSEHLEV